jgi:pimeloyl-ACP methyl ester carboxylesterase
MGYVAGNGIRLFVEERGAGLPLVLLHAYPMGRQMWEPQVPFFAAQGFRALWYDCRGFGLSEAPGEVSLYSQDTSVEDLHALLRALGIRRAALCGLSMGGSIALSFASRHPETVSALAVCDTGAGSEDPAAFAATVTGWAEAAEQGSVPAFLDLLLAHPIFGGFAGRGKTEAAMLGRLIGSHPAHGLACTARRTLAQRPPIYALAERLKGLTVPTLVLVGERDHPCLATSRFMAETIPGAELVVMRGAGHFVNLEAPDEFNRVVLAFLQRAGAAPVPA